MASPERTAAVAQALREYLARMRGPRPASPDPLDVTVIERVMIEKFDKTDVATPGVEGLAPFERIIVEDGKITQIHRLVQGRMVDVTESAQGTAQAMDRTEDR